MYKYVLNTISHDDRQRDSQSHESLSSFAFILLYCRFISFCIFMHRELKIFLGMTNVLAFNFNYTHRHTHIRT